MKDKFLQFLGLIKKAGKLKEGYNKSEESLKNGYSKLIILSVGASENTKDKFNVYCERYKSQIMQCYTPEEIGNAIGRAQINVVCITDEKMAARLLEIFKEQNNNRG